MGRWEPGAADRLRAAALELYVERGFDETTVADIAERAGVTARTFFRHFADKREVLFAGSSELVDAMVAAVADAPASVPPLVAVGRALDAAAELIGRRRAFARQRHAVIAANPELQERELIKLAILSTALTDALRARKVADVDARLAAEAGIAVFRTAFERWAGSARGPNLARLMQESLAQLRVLANAGAD